MQNVIFANETSDLQVADYHGSPGPGATLPQDRLTEHVMEWRHMLARVVSSEIVPRLILMQQDCASSKNSTQTPALPADVTGFTRSLIAPEGLAAQLFLEQVERLGLAPETILLEFFAPAARHLGELWTSDDCDFIQVSVGLHRLQSLMDEICSRHDIGSGASSNAPRILLLPAPGETHEFGVAMVANFFRSDGWRVTASSPETLLHHLSDTAYQIIGVSLSCERHVDQLRDLLRKARRFSRNSTVRILVGGAVFINNPGLAADLGADGTAIDAQGAVQLARSLLDGSVVL